MVTADILKNKKFRVIATILIILIGLIVLNLIARLCISVFNKINGNEIDVIIFQIVGTLICLGMTGICCYISANLARKKNRNIFFWIAAAIFANVFAIFYLYKLPSLETEK